MHGAFAKSILELGMLMGFAGQVHFGIDRQCYCQEGLQLSNLDVSLLELSQQPDTEAVCDDACSICCAHFDASRAGKVKSEQTFGAGMCLQAGK